jgi:hypothetical protein
MFNHPHASGDSPSCDQSLVRVLKQAVLSGASAGDVSSRHAAVSAVLVALESFLTSFGGFSYFLLPQEPFKFMRRSLGDTVQFLQPQKGGYVAFRCELSACSSMQTFIRAGLSLMGEITDVLSVAGDVASCDGSGGSFIGDSVVGLIDDLQKRLDEFRGGRCARTTLRLFGFHSNDPGNCNTQGEVYFGGDDFAGLLTSLNACMLSYASCQELLSAAMHESLSEPLQNICFPNVCAIINLQSNISNWVASAITSAPRAAADTFVHFVAVCCQLRQLGNFQGVVSVMCGIELAISEGCSVCYENAAAADQDRYNRLRKLCSPLGRYQVYCDLFFARKTCLCSSSIQKQF